MGTMELQVVPERQNAAGSIGIFERTSLFTERLVCMEKTEFLQANNVRLLDHTPCSSDFNHIKNLWEWITRDVYKNGTQFETVVLFAKLCSPPG